MTSQSFVVQVGGARSSAAVVADIIVQSRRLRGLEAELRGPSSGAQRFRELVADGTLRRSERPVPWNVDTQQPLALSEVDTAHVEVTPVYVAFPLHGDLTAWGFLEGKQVSVVVAVTQPWSVPAVQALSVCADQEYVFFELSPGRVVVLAKDSLAEVMAELAPQALQVRDVTLGGASFGAAVFARMTQVLGYALGEELVGRQVLHPLAGRPLPVVAGPEGLHALAPAHDPQAFETFGGAPETPVQRDGRFGPGSGLEGRLAVDADEDVVRLLEQRGAVLGRGEPVTVTRPVRAGRPVLLLGTSQWMISTDDRVVPMTIAPPAARARLEASIRSNPHWAIADETDPWFPGAGPAALCVTTADWAPFLIRMKYPFQAMLVLGAREEGPDTAVYRWAVCASDVRFDAQLDLAGAEAALERLRERLRSTGAPMTPAWEASLAALTARLLDAYERFDFHVVEAEVLAFVAQGPLPDAVIAQVQRLLAPLVGASSG